MHSMRLAFVATLCTLAGSEVSSAHDFGSGPNLGGPPKSRQPTIRLMDLMPAGADTATVARVRGVIDRTKMWPQESVLVACFLSGTPAAKTRVAEIAMDWTNYVNIKFDFGSLDAPRTCSSTNIEQIKIDFFSSGDNAGHWSYIGIDSRSFLHSMNLNGFGGDALPVPEDEYRSVVLHEFGHALGFEHEHQSPDAKCQAEFDTPKVTAWAGRMNWSQADVTTNLAQLAPTTSRIFTRHDRKSIMHYSLPEELFVGGKTNKCWVEKNLELSDGDKEFAARMYPNNPRVASVTQEVAGGARVATRGGVRAAPTPKQVEAGYRAELLAAYQGVLAQSGVAKPEAEKLAADFKQELAKVRDGKAVGPRTSAK
jgi:hypothetical protein